MATLQNPEQRQQQLLHAQFIRENDTLNASSERVRRSPLFRQCYNRVLKDSKPRFFTADAQVCTPDQLSQLVTQALKSAEHLVLSVSVDVLTDETSWYNYLNTLRDRMQAEGGNLSMITVQGWLSVSVLQVLVKTLPRITYCNLANAYPITQEALHIVRGWSELVELHLNCFPHPDVNPTALFHDMGQWQCWALEHVELWNTSELKSDDHAPLFRMPHLKRIALHHHHDANLLDHVDHRWRVAHSVEPAGWIHHTDPVFRDTFTLFLVRYILAPRGFNIAGKNTLVRPLVQGADAQSHTVFGFVNHVHLRKLADQMIQEHQ